MEIEDDSGVQDLQPRTSVPSRSGKSAMIGLDEDFKKILNWLAGNSLGRDTLAILGMPGIGKTTFARKVYDHQRFQDTFHVCAWVTVSQKYDERKILLDLLDSMKHSGEPHKLGTSALKDKLHQNLKGRRYLIVVDDIWETEVWNDVNNLFPDDKKKSRIILTTRLKEVALHVKSSTHQMRFLNDIESRNLFCKKVFGGDCCPGELNQIGNEIAKKCGGLPLAIVLIGGLLSKSTQTQSYWEYVAKNLSSVITSHGNQSSKILYLSYNNLPHHLRACFLYMGIFPEDYEIFASKLVKLWIAEGFIEPDMTSKTLEDVAEEYLLNLVERSLISVSKRSSRGKIRKCKIHDLLHEFCVREAKKESFFHVTDRSLHHLPSYISINHITDTSSQSLPKNIISLRRVSIHPNTQTNCLHAASLPTSTVRTVLNFDPTLSLSVEFLNSSLLRVLDTVNGNSFDFPTETVELLNLRFLACLSGNRELPSSMYKLRNLQTLILSCMESSFRLPFEIWRMPQLRHVHFDSVILPDPPVAGVEGEKSLIVLQDLQSLSTVINFKFVEDILRRIPNLKKLGILYDDISEDRSDYLNNLVLLKNLEALKCLFSWPYQTFLQKIIFPPSLKKLTLRGCFLPWEDMTIVGSLPKLEVLKLKRKAFSGAVWEPKEGEFLQLKFLLLEENNLEDWNAEGTHFPILEHLILHNCQRLKEVPCGIGEILALQKIELYYCSDLLVTSAKDIYVEQHNSGNEDFQFRIVQNRKMTAEEFETC